MVIYMTKTSAKLIQGVLKTIADTDATFTERDENTINQVINGTFYEQQPDFLLTRSLVAKIIGKDEKTVDFYCSRGDFKKIKIGNSKKACGISALSVANATGIGINSIYATQQKLK